MHWIEIYPQDDVLCLSKNWGLDGAAGTKDLLSKESFKIQSHNYTCKLVADYL